MQETITRSDQIHWGTIEGKDIWLFCLRNKKRSRLYLSNYGATAQSFFIADKDGRLGDVLLGYDHLEDYTSDAFYMGSVVGRNANRIGGGRIRLDGKEYALASGPDGIHLHGGEEGFNKKIYDFQFVDNSSGTSIVFTYQSKHLEEGFPGNLKLEVKYSLDEEDYWTVEYHATTDETTVVNLTQHAYFNLSGNSAKSILDHELRIPADYYLPMNSLQLPTGTIASVFDTPFDFRKFHTIGQRISDLNEQLQIGNGYNHSFVLEREKTTRLKHAATVKEKSSGRKLDVYTTEPAVHLYTGNFLRGILGKNSIPYKPHSGFCLETQHFPDAPNHPAFPSTILKPDERYYSRTVFAFSQIW